MANRIGTLADAQAWAAEIAGFAPLALQHAKRVLNDDGAYEDPWPEHQELFDRAWASQDVIEAQVARIEKRPPTVPGRLMMFARRCASAFGTAVVCWPAAGCCARCSGAPAGAGRLARPRSTAVARRSPNYRDGVFVNVEPASGISLDREEQRHARPGR